LLHQAKDIQPMNDSASNRGVSIYVIAAYADPARTVIFLRITDKNAGTGFVRPDALTLSDQFGHQFSEVPPIGTSVVQPNGVWTGSMDFEGISNWDQVAGLRLTLKVTSMLWSSYKDNRTKTIPGQWTVKWVQPTTPVGQAHSFIMDQVPSGIPVRLLQIQLAPSATVFDLSITGGKYNFPTFGYVECVSDGKKYDLLGGAEPDKIVTAPLERPGKYLLVITDYDKKNVRWELPFSLIN